MITKKNIRELKLEELINFLKNQNIPSYRAKQIHEWLWKKRAVNFNEMTSLSLSLRDLLEQNFSLNAVKIHKAERSNDGTIKYSLKLHDNKLVEGVLIPSKKRLTACVSSQVGCSLSCTFCATGTLKLERNLNYSEITIENCEELSFASEFIYLDPPDYLIVTDAEGFVIETELRIVDLAEAITWLLILFSIEAAVMLQERSIGISPSSGFLSSLGSVASLKLLNRAKVILYCLLWVAIAYWLFRGHYVWAWDEFVWIAGFVLIENNISGWREETTELDSLSQAIKENNAL